MRRTLPVPILAATFFVPVLVLRGLAAAPPSEPAPRPARLAAPQPVAIALDASAPQAQASADTVVYITRTGKKYHNDGCPSLSRSRIPIKLQDAVARGYTPCSTCRPPTLDQTAPAQGVTPPAPRAALSGVATQDNGDTIVYITKTGKKYHGDACRSLAKSKTPIKLRDAVARGYTPCSICKPPVLKKK